MIVEVRYENFRSLKEKTVFDLSAESICEFRNSVIRWNRNKTDEFRVVPLKILYGQNASGKTNMMLGIQLLKELILQQNTLLHKHGYQMLVNGEGTHKPITLGITFLHAHKVIDYDVSFYEDRIVYEQLSVNRCRLFERFEHSISIAKTSKATEFFDETRVSTLEMNEKQSTAYISQGLFLTLGFRAFIAPTLVDEITQYFQEHICVILNSAEFLSGELHLKQENQVREFLNEIGQKDVLDTPYPPSDGMLKLIQLADLLFDSFEHGKTLIMNEMETGMNPTLLMPLLSRLHESDNQNTQLVFDTHNPVYLDKQLIRRDEITFVTKTEEGTHLKVLLSYANRENNYLRKYMSGEYETIPVTKLKVYN